MPADRRDARERAGLTAGAAPWTVRAVAVLALVEALGTVGFAVRFVIDVLPLEEPRLLRAGFALGMVVCVLGAAAVLLAAARAIRRAQSWARSLLVVAQVMALAIGLPMAQGGDWVGWLIAAMGVAGIGLLLHPATTAALTLADG